MSPACHQLQWKKSGPHVVAWRSHPGASDGFTSGRALSVWTHSRYLWSAQPLSPVRLTEERRWADVRDTSLSFTLSEPVQLRLVYSMVVRPDQGNATDQLQRRDDVAARLVVNGLAYRESGSALSLTCLISCAGVLEGEVSLRLQPGRHNVSLQWHKFGAFTRAWRSDPSLLDGYAASRSLIAIGERFDLPHAAPLERLRARDRRWATVGNHSLTFSLHTPAVVLFTYSLPVTQHGHPNFDSWTYERWNSIAARLVVDSVPYRCVGRPIDQCPRLLSIARSAHLWSYVLAIPCRGSFLTCAFSPHVCILSRRHGASGVDGSVRVKSILRGQLMLELQPGTHTARLQWMAHADEKGASWMDLNSIEGGFMGGGNLLAMVHVQKNAPRLLAPANLTLRGWEDRPIVLSELFYVEDIEEDAAQDYMVAIMLQARHGLLSLGSLDRLAFISGDGNQDQFMYFTGARPRPHHDGDIHLFMMTESLLCI